MWRKLLDKVFPRVWDIGASRPGRHRWLVESLEGRLLLSADLLPAADVLQILGTEGDDSAVIRTLESDTGGAAQLLVILNGRSLEFTFEPGQSIHIDLLGGNDSLEAEVTVDADWTFVLGEGGDRTSIDVLIGEHSSAAHYCIDSGDGDNETAVRFGDGKQGELPPSGQTNITAEYRSGAGKDNLALGWLVHLDRPLDVIVDVDTGAGDDNVAGQWEHQYEFRSGKWAHFDHEFQLGDGDDTLAIDFTGALGEMDFTADTGAGNDTVRSNVSAIWLTTGVFNAETGDGDDVIDMATVIHVDPDLAAELRAALTADAGEGKDRVYLDWTDTASTLDFDLIVRLGQKASFLLETNDEVLLGFEHGDIEAPIIIGTVWNGADIPPESGEAPVREFLLSVDGASAIIDADLKAILGGGKDNVDVKLRSDALDRVETVVDLDLDLGAGADTLRLDAFSGAESTSDLMGLLLKGHIQSLDTLSILTLFPLGELTMSQAIEDDRTGHSSANFDLLLDAADLTAIIRTAAADDSLTFLPAVQRLLAASAMIEFEGGAGVDAAVLDMGAADAPVLGSFSEVSGLTGELSVAEYRAGVDVGEDFKLQLDLAGLESLLLNTGRSDDEIRVDLDHPQGLVPELAISTGNGDDTVEASFIGILGDVVFNLDTGEGDDVVNGNVTESNTIVTGAGPGVGPHVKAFSGAASVETQSFFAYASSFNGGVRVAAGDINGDGVADIITGAGPGAGPHVKVFDGRSSTEIRSFFAYTPSFTGGVYVAVGDVNGDGRADIITAPDNGAGPHVKVFDGTTGAEIRSFFAYAPSFIGGVRVAAGDVNGDGRVDIITAPGNGAGPHVRVFDGITGSEIRSFFAYDPAFTGGVYVAAGDINGDTLDDIVTGTDGGGSPHVKAFDGMSLAVLQNFFAYSPSFIGGVRVAAGDINGDGRADIITGAGPGAGPHVKAFDGAVGAEIRSFFAYDPGFRGGVYVAAISIDPGNTFEHGVFDVTLDTNAGHDQVDWAFITGHARRDVLDVDMGSGADDFTLVWKGALHDPVVVHRFILQVDLGGTDPGESESGDLVRARFLDGDRVVHSLYWSSGDGLTPDGKSLRLEMNTEGGFLGLLNELAGGADNDSMQLFFEGKLKVGGVSPQLHVVADMGAGNDDVSVNFAALEIEGSGKGTPIALDIQGGEGNDAVLVTGTDGADRFSVTEKTVFLDGISSVGYAGMESLRVNTRAGDDSVTMTGIDPATRTTIDGGGGRDRFVGRFDSGFAGNLTLLNFEQTTIQVRGRVSGTLASEVPVPLRQLSGNDDEEEIVFL